MLCLNVTTETNQLNSKYIFYTRVYQSIEGAMNFEGGKKYEMFILSVTDFLRTKCCIVDFYANFMH